jgi:hypothetical protein
LKKLEERDQKLVARLEENKIKNWKKPVKKLEETSQKTGRNWSRNWKKPLKNQNKPIKNGRNLFTS